MSPGDHDRFAEQFLADYESDCEPVADRDRRLQRQQGRMMRTLREAIDGGIEDLYALLGYAPGGGSLLLRGPHRVAQTLVVVGILKARHVRGCAPAPINAVRLVLRRIGYRVLRVNEWCTSKCCDLCGAYTVKTRAHSVRHWRCEHDNGRVRQGQQRNDHVHRHAAEQNKDVYASRSMIRIMLSLLVLGRRPAHLTPSAKSGKQKGAATSGGSTKRRSKRGEKREPTTTTTSTTTMLGEPLTKRHAGNNNNVNDDDDDNDNNNAAVVDDKQQQSADKRSAAARTQKRGVTYSAHVPQQKSRQQLTD